MHAHMTKRMTAIGRLRQRTGTGPAAHSPRQEQGSQVRPGILALLPLHSAVQALDLRVRELLDGLP
eukprot:CAMPEP_0175607256 /NCGR_PEP_ID=MMETSP0096-20121207/61138_1 /TAXON_ID=311494 /ORGANISM="Alexandrium monilatum, Strain CCMP3105" /LENGTH=65 /DNA_ID=CAMNT_0016912113 /DNA_START=235 /DNA_END=429 /DNA_ORIENTATION=+